MPKNSHPSRGCTLAAVAALAAAAAAAAEPNDDPADTQAPSVRASEDFDTCEGLVVWLAGARHENPELYADVIAEDETRLRARLGEGMLPCPDGIEDLSFEPDAAAQGERQAVQTMLSAPELVVIAPPSVNTLLNGLGLAMSVVEFVAHPSIGGAVSAGSDAVTFIASCLDDNERRAVDGLSLTYLCVGSEPLTVVCSHGALEVPVDGNLGDVLGVIADEIRRTEASLDAEP